MLTVLEQLVLCPLRTRHLQVYLDMLLEPLPAENTWSKRLMQVGLLPWQPASQGAEPLCCVCSGSAPGDRLQRVNFSHH